MGLNHPAKSAAFKMSATSCLRFIFIGMFTFVQRNNCSLWTYILGLFPLIYMEEE